MTGKQTEKKAQWKTPTVTEFEIAERTKSDPFTDGDLTALGTDPGGPGS
jgi:hypothetical protein